MKYALLTVSDKTGLIDFATFLQSQKYKIISTGGTAKVLTDAGISIIPIQEVTGNPESFDGRMKTISFQIESALLYDRKNPSHKKQAKEFGTLDIDIVVCNFYPFEKNLDIEHIDIGGPTMVRAAAKNYKNVMVVIDPNDYQQIMKGKFDRRNLAAKAFDHCAFYDAQVGRYLRDESFPEEIALAGRKGFAIRYGENPHQKASIYFEPNTNSPLKNLSKLTGRDLSYCNVTDIAAGLEVVRQFSDPTVAVIKHNTPSGIALGKSSSEALARAVEADPESAFGGIIVFNTPLDLNAAKTFASFKEENGVLIDIVAAPEITEEAKEFIKGVRKSTGIYTFGQIPSFRSNTLHTRFFDGGFLLQDWDDRKKSEWKTVTKNKPTKKQLIQMEFAWKCIGRIRSNTILIIDPEIPMTRGIGSGQTSRIRSAKIAIEQAGKKTNGAILASDSFFPFGDTVKLAASYNIAAIIQQGGSINDQSSIDEANKAGIPMLFTGERKFWH